MAYFTTSQISKAKEIDLLTYLQNNNPDELVYESRNTYHTRTHDSLKINNGMWYWFSRNIGGKTALEYLIQVEEYSFTDAVSHLLNQKGLEKRYIPKLILTEKEKIERLDLPKKAPNNFKVISYLLSRGISKNIIDECINKGFIYQEYPKNNVVFVGYDDNNIPRYAGVRGTNSSRYMHDAYGSDKAYSFKLKSVIQNNSVHLFESAIDLLSYATFKELNNEKWDEENLLSLAGIYSPGKDVLNSKIPKTISTFLKSNSNIDTIYIHFDNDNAGRIATEALINSFSDSYKTINDPPKSGKDYNDYLCDFLKINHHKNYEMYR